MRPVLSEKKKQGNQSEHDDGTNQSLAVHWSAGFVRMSYTVVMVHGLLHK